MNERMNTLESESAGKQRLTGATESALQTAKDKAQSLGHEGKERALEEIDVRKSGVAEELSRLGQALDSSAREVSRSGDSFIANPLQQVARFCEQASSSLSQKGPRQLFADVENFGRREPALFFGLALAAGFMATRLLRSDPDEVTEDGRKFDQLEGFENPMQRGH